jgi:pimeloyl-ACP methyl ester carboxylesterase
MDDTPANAARVKPCSIILVHGTWARGFFPKRREISLYTPNKRWWFEEGSQFRAGLDAALKNASLDWQIRAFLWSGANSVHARDDAARELADQLRKDLDDPNGTAFIIAHSHGGNVALRALQHLDSTAGRIRIVTLATPFLRVVARRPFQLPLLVKNVFWCLVDNNRRQRRMNVLSILAMLEKSVRDHLKRRYEQLLQQGQLPSREKLQEYYATFRAHFAPDRLRQLDGEELLNTIHAHGNRDSLVYWLEFKNDEEFQEGFASIAGGSALKLSRLPAHIEISLLLARKSLRNSQPIHLMIIIRSFKSEWRREHQM